MSDTQTEAPIMIRVDLTREELRLLKLKALEQNKAPRVYLAEVLRERLT
jgi:hypothetical protein